MTKEKTESFSLSKRDSRTLKILLLLILAGFGLYFWYIGIPAFLAWLIWKKVKLNKKHKNIAFASLAGLTIILWASLAFANRAPSLKITEPENNFSTQDTQINIKGKVSPKDARLELGGGSVGLNEDGEFSYRVNLPNEKNNFVFTAFNGDKRVERVLTINRILTEEEKAQLEAQREEARKRAEEARAVARKEKEELIAKRSEYNPKRGSNHEAASTAQGFMDLFKMSSPNVGIDMYLKLMAQGSSESAYADGGDLNTYRKQVEGAFLTVVISNTYWRLINDSVKKDLTATFVSSLHTLYPDAAIGVTIDNNIRTVAEGSWSLWNGEPKVELK